MKRKKELRQEILQLRDALTEEERREKSHQIAEKVIIRKEFMEADKILLFASYKSEVYTSEIFQAAQKLRKAVYYPKIMGSEMEFYLVEKEDDLVEGYRGIREPQATQEKKYVPQPTDKICIIMPGAVFDVEGNRIGYGGGYYDKYMHRLLLTVQIKEEGCQISESYVGKVYKLAVAFECQIVEVGRITSEQHDIKSNCIVTEGHIIEVA